MANPERQPGDLILDRFMPDAASEQREEARENLRRLARLILRVEKRLAAEWREQQIRDSGPLGVESKRDASPLS